ncbi:MAG: YggT family protein [Actinomycetota bacterium]|nr:YggT family protein [Actinomycetota bacterium]
MAEPNCEGVGVNVAAVRLLFDTIDSIQSFVEVFIYVYVLLIFVFILTSWVRLPYSPWLQRIQRFLFDVCDPYLRLFRRVLPPLGPLDLSPVVAVIVLLILARVLSAALESLH